MAKVLAQGEHSGLWWPVILGVTLVVCGLALYRGWSHYRQLQQELTQLRQVNQQLARHNRSLYRRVQRLRRDPRALARAARREMGLVRPDEVVYQDAPAAPGGEEP